MGRDPRLVSIAGIRIPLIDRLMRANNGSTKQETATRSRE